MHMTILHLCRVSLVVLLLLSWTSTLLWAWSGTVVEKGTGQPITGAVVVRSWRRYIFNPVHPVSRPATFSETRTDEQGRFLLLGLSRLLHPSIPVFGPLEENPAFIFKAGYRFTTLNEQTERIELEKIPHSLAVRSEELSKARGNYFVEQSETKHLKAAIEKEEAELKSVPRYVLGVFHHADHSDKRALIAPEDIEIDQEGMVYVGDACFPTRVFKFTSEGTLLTVRRMPATSCSKIDFELTPAGDFISFFQQKLVSLDKRTFQITIRAHYNPVSRRFVFPTTANMSRFALTKDDTAVFLLCQGPKKPPAVCRYDFQGTLLQKRQLSQGETPPWPMWPVDIVAGADGNFLILYRKGGSYTEGGVLKLDAQLNTLSQTPISTQAEITAMTTLSQQIIVADKATVYFYDPDMTLQYMEFVQNNKELGEVRITRMKADKNEEYLYLIDQRYRRILKYHLPTHQWVARQ